MSENADITLCLTIGKRPDELRQTLDSLFQFEQFEHIIAINDFGDEETNSVFQELCPHGKLISLGHHVGHHRAVDTMYQQVKTPYIFHCEDDWLFAAPLFFDKARVLLESEEINSVCVRDISDFPFTEEDKGRILTASYSNVEYKRLDKLHSQWHRFTFNPNLMKIDLWREADCCFSQFKKERHISRWQGGLGKYIAFMPQGACRHIGEGVSVARASVTPSHFKRIRKRLKAWVISYFRR